MAEMTVKETIELMPRAISARATRGEHATIQWTITGEGGGNWYMVIDDGKCTVHEGANEPANAGLQMSAKTFMDLRYGKLSGVKAFLTGKVKISGNQAILMKLQRWLPQP